MTLYWKHFQIVSFELQSKYFFFIGRIEAMNFLLALIVRIWWNVLHVNYMFRWKDIGSCWYGRRLYIASRRVALIIANFGCY